MKYLGVLWAVAAVAACGGKAEPEPEAGSGTGGSGTGGSGTAGFGGEDEAPPSQAAASYRIFSASPAPAGKMCPSGALWEGEIPAVSSPDFKLTNQTYREHVVDGEGGAAVRCRVAAGGSFEFSGEIRQNGKALLIQDGAVVGGRGTATISLADSSGLSGALTSAAPCAIDVMTPQLQINPGSMWASFSCSSIERAPSDYCAASGYFVLENCAMD